MEFKIGQVPLFPEIKCFLRTNIQQTNHLCNHTELLADLNESINTAVDLLQSVSTAHLGSNTSLTKRHHRIAKANN